MSDFLVEAVISFTVDTQEILIHRSSGVILAVSLPCWHNLLMRVKR